MSNSTLSIAIAIVIAQYMPMYEVLHAVDHWNYPKFEAKVRGWLVLIFLS